MAYDIQAFKQEKRTLLIILSIFDCTYVMRALYDLIYASDGGG